MTRPWTIGVSTFVWKSPLLTKDVGRVLGHIRWLGFESVEIPLEFPEVLSVKELRRAVGESGLTPVIGAVLSSGRELCASDQDTIGATQDYLRTCIDYAAEIGAMVVAGPMYSSVGRCWRTSVKERARIVGEFQEALAPVVEYAASTGRRLAVEPLNRYETSTFNTVDQLLPALEPFDVRTVGIVFDSYHANIEEKRPWEALRRCGDRLLYVQASASDRGAPGRDHIDWAGMSAALSGLGYNGEVTIESFTPDNQSIAVAASIWRALEADADDLASAGLSFLRTLRSDCGYEPTEDA